MTRYTDMNNLPGPGDEETWGPCTGHPMDPRTEDVFSDDEIEEKKIEMAKERVADSLDWVREAFSEADDAPLLEMFHSFLNARPGEIGTIADQLMDGYILPTDEEVVEALTEERSDDRA